MTKHLPLSVLLLASAAALPASAQEARHLSAVVPFAPGGIVDVLARALAPDLSSTLGLPVVVENVPGAGGALGVRRAQEGVSLLVAPASIVSVNPALAKEPGYDVSTLVPLCGVAYFDIVLAVPVASPIRRVHDLRALADAKGGRVAFGWANTTNQLLQRTLLQKLGVGATEVPYPGKMGLAMTDLIAGHIDAAFTSTEVARGLADGGKVRIIASASDVRSPVFPGAPTLGEDLGEWPKTLAWVGIFATARVAPEMRARVSEALESVLRAPAFRQMLETQALRPMGACDDFPAEVERSGETWRTIARQAGLGG